MAIDNDMLGKLLAATNHKNTSRGRPRRPGLGVSGAIRSHSSSVKSHG